ncbi:RNA polymerase sigma factor [Nocardia thraciensis]
MAESAGGSEFASAEEHSDDPGTDHHIEWLERHTRDVELLIDAHRYGTDSPQYKRLERRLVRYATAVLAAWVRHRYIFKEVRRRKGIELDPTPEELSRLNDDHDLCDELVTETVIRAIGRLRRQVDGNTGWDPDGGADVRTYFIGGCVLDFADVYRKFRRDIARDRQRHSACINDHAANSPHGADIGAYGSIEAAVDARDLQDRINALSEREQVIVRAKIDGYSNAEIAELYNFPSDAAVRATLHRLRRRMPEINQEPGKEDREQ